jgi:hypothetical protein
MPFSIEIEKSVLKFMRMHERLRIMKAVLNKKVNAGCSTTPFFKLHHRTTV